ncbi:MAG TPA: hypothetical protein VK504_17425 [Vicinamibacterales bacterium]|nr:hypothetical protein [Vicinamibacterales bacterium]
MVNMPVALHCYRPAPRHLSLPPLQQLVLAVLRDAKGFFRSSGMTVGDVRQRLGVGSAADVRAALVALTAAGYAKQVDAGHWRLA